MYYKNPLNVSFKFKSELTEPQSTKLLDFVVTPCLAEGLLLALC